MTSKRRVKSIKRRRRKVRKLRFTMFIVTVALIGYIGYKTSEKIFSSMINNKEVQKVETVQKVEEDNLSKIPEEVKNSKDPVIQSLLKKANKYPEINKILNNIDAYPKELLELASKKDEEIDFVANYPNYDAAKNKAISIKQDYKKGQIPLFIQWDERWGYEKYGSEFIAINGCGPTALSMVAVGLTDNTNINPKVVADFSEKNGYLAEGVGSTWSLMTEGAKNFGVTGKELSLNKEVIINTLKKGQPIIASMGPGTFTTTGHFIVLTGVDSNNKIIVNDPDSKIKSKQTWDIDIFMNEATNLWAFKAI
ncbi:C39 family peptidase [Clostridium sp. MB05]|uniref:C39 family peptidase n=1 Tax=Clostridium sp. MB05 TaxID=3376682 RepID=UPI0039824B57